MIFPWARNRLAHDDYFSSFIMSALLGFALLIFILVNCELFPGLIVDLHGYHLDKGVDENHCTTLPNDVLLHTHIWEHIADIGIGFIFIVQATHQSAAIAAYFGWIKRQVLEAGHTYAHRFKAGKVSLAAQRFPAGS